MRALFDIEPEDRAVGVPDLQGSEAQVKWAIKVRTAMLPRLDKAVREWRRRVRDLQIHGDPEKRRKAEERLGHVIQRVEAIRAIDRASWWLDHRDNDVTELIDDGPAKPGSIFR